MWPTTTGLSALRETANDHIFIHPTPSPMTIQTPQPLPDAEDEGTAASEPHANPGEFHLRLEHQLHRLEKLLHLHDRGELEPTESSVAAPAWRRQTSGEHRAAVVTAMVVTIGLLAVLPERVSIHPRVMLPAFAASLLVALVVASPNRLRGESRWLRVLSLALIGVLSIANAATGARLVIDLAHSEGIKSPGVLLLTGAAIWLTNILVFSLWYWESDRGGPVQRALGSKEHPDFLFPQMGNTGVCGEHWEPFYVDQRHGLQPYRRHAAVTLGEAHHDVPIVRFCRHDRTRHRSRRKRP
jgi:hypothetical protein